MNRRLPGHKLFLFFYRGALRRVRGCASIAAVLLSTGAFAAGFIPPEKLDPGQSSKPSLDISYEREAWLVYTYEVDGQGAVVNPKIHASNAVTEVEDRVLGHLKTMAYRPATRDGRPVRVSIGPISYTWILDIPREMSPEFEAIYQQAWTHYKEQNFDLSFEYAARLKSFPGRSAYEEVKFRVLAASLASRWEDNAGELTHLERIVDFQRLADRNHFRKPYVDAAQYQLILERIHTLQLAKMMLADAEATLADMQTRDSESTATLRAISAQEAAREQFMDYPDVEIEGMLTALYTGGRGAWESRLFRARFSVSNVKGSIDSVFLACAEGNEQRLQYPSREIWVVPEEWEDCKVEVTGKSGARFIVHQLAGN